MPQELLASPTTQRQPTPTLAWWRLPHVPIWASAAIASFLTFGWTLNGYFLSEDFANVARFLDYPLSEWPRLFVGDWSGGLWGFELPELRPVIALSFIVDSQLWGTNPFGFRLTNLLFHIACAALVGLIAHRVTRRDATCGVAAAVLFALHPVHAYDVAPICGRGDVIVTAFYLAGFLAFHRYRERADARWLAVFALSYALAVFSKEYGFTLVFLLVVADGTWLGRLAAWRQRSTWAPYVCCFAVAVIYFSCRWVAFRFSTPVADEVDLSVSSLLFRFAKSQTLYFAHLFPPLAEWLQIWRKGDLPILPWVPLQLGLAILLCALVVSGLWRNDRGRALARGWGPQLLFCLGWHVVATGPLVLTYFAPRHLYLASGAVCIAMAIVLLHVTRSRRWFVAGAAALAALYVLQLERALQHWDDSAAISREVSEEFGRTARAAPPGSAILLDAPENVGNAVCWAWAFPFATQPPFFAHRVRDDIVVFEAPGASAFFKRWPDPTVVAALANIEQESFIIELTEARTLRRRVVPAAKVRAAAAQLGPASSEAAGRAAWQKFLADVNTP